MGSVVVPLTVLAGGAALVYVGITNPAGGAFAGLGNLIRGVPNTPANAGNTTFLADLAGSTGALAQAGQGIAGSLQSVTGVLSVTGRRRKVVQEAETWLGVPYKFGGNTRAGVDCSGFTLQVFATVGIHLPRVSMAQALRGKRVPASQAEPGDLVAFGTPVHHVGIYLGNGQMINAPHTGSVVRVEAVAYPGAGRIQYRRLLPAQGVKPAHPKPGGGGHGF